MQHRPFPEIVTGENDWEVFEETERPRTDMTNKKMYCICKHRTNHNRL